MSRVRTVRTVRKVRTVLWCQGAKGARVLGAMVLGTSILSGQTLPPGPGVEVLKSKCVICHESDIITSQKLSLTGWTNSVGKMIRWGSQITPEERAVLQPYLAAHFGPKPAASHSPTVLSTVAPAKVEALADVGATPALRTAEGTYKRTCLTCHDADIIAQQKLSKTGWTRSVEKMMRWGASVPDAEKEPLIEYLAARFPPR